MNVTGEYRFRTPGFPQGGDKYKYNAATRGLSIQQGTQNATAWGVLYPSPSGREPTCTMTTAQDHTPTTFMRSVSVSDFRCFGDEQTAKLAPLTLFVGDNSTGKSSLMALMAVLWEVLFFRHLQPDFNREPFNLGGFRDMVHFRGGRGERRTSFSAGMALDDPSDHSDCLETNVTFREKNGYPEARSFAYMVDGHSIEVSHGTKQVTFTYQKPGASPFAFQQLDFSEFPSDVDQYALSRRLQQVVMDELMLPPEEPKKSLDTVRRSLIAIKMFLTQYGLRQFNFAATAPLRAQPERIYLLGSSMTDPGAYNLPSQLLTTKQSNPLLWRRLKESIEMFGMRSDLFSQFDVSPVANGKGLGPFEMRVRGNPNQPQRVGPWRNLVDVGYGVSQILPLICRLSDPSVHLHLIQQPEIHLHPKAQAALGSFLCRWVTEGRGQLIIETHSQYLLDRVRMEVRDSRIDIKPTDVSVAFFESHGLESRIANIGFDHLGNVTGAPPGYDNFFVGEVTRSIGL